MVHIVIIPLGQPNLKEAIDKAIESTKGAVALTDGVLYTKAWSVILYGQASYIVEGNALIDPAYAGSDVDLNKETFVQIKLNKKGEVISKTNLTEDEYNAAKTKVVKNAKKTAITSEVKG